MEVLCDYWVSGLEVWHYKNFFCRRDRGWRYADLLDLQFQMCPELDPRVAAGVALLRFTAHLSWGDIMAGQSQDGSIILRSICPDLQGVICGRPFYMPDRRPTVPVLWG